MGARRPRILIVMGYGDERPFIQWLIRWRWWLLGYEVHFHIYRWEVGPFSLPERTEALISHARQLACDDLDLYVIGISAGGVPAVLLLESDIQIKRVVTIASPLLWADIPTKQLLIDAYHAADDLLKRRLHEVGKRIVSIHGQSDESVAVWLSKRDGITTLQLPTDGHYPTIRMALLTRHCRAVQRCLTGV